MDHRSPRKKQLNKSTRLRYLEALQVDVAEEELVLNFAATSGVAIETARRWRVIRAVIHDMGHVPSVDLLASIVTMRGIETTPKQIGRDLLALGWKREELVRE